MSRAQQLMALVSYTVADYMCHDTVTFILDNIQLTDSEFENVHHNILRSIPGIINSINQQKILMEYTHNTEQYATHPQVLRRFIECRRSTT